VNPALDSIFFLINPINFFSQIQNKKTNKKRNKHCKTNSTIRNKSALSNSYGFCW